jgi:hypothetical protein
MSSSSYINPQGTYPVAPGTAYGRHSDHAGVMPWRVCVCTAPGCEGCRVIMVRRAMSVLTDLEAAHRMV